MESFDFGRNLLRLRKNKSMTQDALGAKAGVSGAQIGRYEKGTDFPGNATLVRLSAALGVPEIELRGLKTADNITQAGKPAITVEEQINWMKIANSLQRLIDDQDREIEQLNKQLEECRSHKLSVN